MPEPTPRPWTWGEETELRGFRCRILSGPEKGWSVLCHQAAWSVSRADADLIVRAVNSHDALVAALEKARNYVPCSCPPFSGGGADPTCGWCEMGRALALARGETDE